MRFKAIDAFRGLAAIFIIFYHMKDTRLVMTNTFVMKSDIFVDFFFVLSGFVISFSNIPRLKQWKDGVLFLQKRFWRLYPLHVFTLLLCLLFEIFRFLVNNYIVHLNQPIFHNNNISTFSAHLMLAQSLNLFDYLSWNIPSWSISTEFYTYIIWAFLLILLRRKLILTAITCILPLAYFFFRYNGNIMFTFDYGLLRCLYSFSIGTLTYQFFQQVNTTVRHWPIYIISIVEFVLFGGTVVIVYLYQKPFTWLIPIWFSIFILFFSVERGVISNLLRHERFEFLGRLSYSYYLNHCLILLVIDLLMFDVVKLPHSVIYELCYIVISLVIIHLFSELTYRYIEIYFQKSGKNVSNHKSQMAKLTASLPNS